MAFTIFQSGTSLYGMDQRGSCIALTLPTGVSLDSTLPARFVVINNYVVMVNSPSRPLTIDANLNVRLLTPDPPAAQFTLSGTAGGTLSGNFKARQTYRVYDTAGRLIAESDYGPTSAAVAIAGQYLTATNGNLSPDRVSSSYYYRTTNGSAVYFPWIELPGNTQTTLRDDLSDAGLQTFSAPRRGTPPDLALVVEFKSRLYGVSKTDKDHFYFTEPGEMFAWPSDNIEAIPRAGSDNRGITGFARRRDALAIGRVNGLYGITRTDDAALSLTNISENAGFVSADATGVFRNIAYFPWLDGVYKWDESGIASISDAKVRRWFTRDDTFNLSRLPYAFAHIDPIRRKYRLFLASAGSSVEDCWIEYDIDTGNWWGPHSSHAMNPSSAFLFALNSGLMVPMIGGTDGYCRIDRKKRVDDTLDAIDFDAVTNWDMNETPDLEKHFGELSVFGAAQPTGQLQVQSVIGEENDARTEVDTDGYQHDLTVTRERIGRLGDGKGLKLRFRNHEPGVDVSIRGYEINPMHVIGRR